jgi:hypothetical protein
VFDHVAAAQDGKGECFQHMFTTYVFNDEVVGMDPLLVHNLSIDTSESTWHTEKSLARTLASQPRFKMVRGNAFATGKSAARQLFRISSKNLSIWPNSYQNPMQFPLFQTSSKF